MTGQKNVNYGTIMADGNVHIGDIIYQLDQRFANSPSILFLRLDKNATGDYVATLSAKNGTTGNVDQYESTILVTIPTHLFQQATAFQHTRRGLDGPTRFGGVLPSHPAQAEATLTETLYKTFFDGELGTICSRFMTLLQQRKLAELLLVISTDDDELLRLPWEMVLPHLTKSTGTLPPNNFGLVRSHLTTLDDFNLQGPTDRAAPLKLLFVTALPENMSEDSKQLEIEKEQRLIIDTVRGLGEPNKPGLVIDILDCASLAEIESALKMRSHDIVHISGHGTYLTDQQHGVLVMEDEDGNQQIVTGTALGDVLQRHSSVKLLVLSACETAAGGVSGSLARQLADVGLPAVLAMRFSVTDEAARLLAEQFYGRLAAGDTLVKAMHEVRTVLWEKAQAVRDANPKSDVAAEWFTPVLFQNQSIGALINWQRTYDAQTHRQFYPPLTFNRSNETRLIGEDFIGRKRVLIQLRQGFRQHKHICLYGMGGLGKTTTAEAFAYHYRLPQGGVPDVLLFREGRYPINELSILNRLVERWKTRVEPDKMRVAETEYILKADTLPVLDKLQQVINNCLSEWPTVLIFDNAEDVHDENGHFTSSDLRNFLRHLLVNVPKQCHIIFTTRYNITDLSDCLMQLPIDKMGYAEQYRCIQSSDRLSSLTTAQQNLLYDRFDGLPRAFEFLDKLLIDQPTFDLDQMVNVESRIIEDLLLDELYNGLSNVEQQVFVQASVFIGRVDIIAISSILEIDEDELRPMLLTLKDKSLCLHYVQSDLYEIHSLTKTWINQKELLEYGRQKNIFHRAGKYFEDGSNFDSLYIAKTYFEQARSWEKFAKISLGLSNYYRLVGSLTKAETTLDEVLLKDISPLQNVQANNQLGTLYIMKGAWKVALIHLKNTLANSQLLVAERVLGAEREEGEIRNNLGFIYKAKGDSEKALEQYDKSLKISQRIGNKEGEGTTLNNISQIYKNRGEHEIALKYLYDSLTISQERDDKYCEGAALHNIGNIYFIQEKYCLCMIYFLRSLSCTILVGDKRGEATILTSLGNLYIIKNDWNNAMKYLEESLVIQQKIGNVLGIAATHHALGVIAHKQSRHYEKAIFHLITAYSINDDIDSSEVIQTESYLHMIYREIGDIRFNQAVINAHNKINC